MHPLLQRRIDALYDLDPLWYALCLAEEGYGELVPHLLPAEPEPPRDLRREAHDWFAGMRREQIAELEHDAPRNAAHVRAEWEAWWAKRS